MAAASVVQEYCSVHCTNRNVVVANVTTTIDSQTGPKFQGVYSRSLNQMLQMYFSPRVRGIPACKDRG